MGRVRIAVLFHKNDRVRKLSAYAIYHLAEFWRRAGHEVVFVFGTDAAVPADIILVHVDLSVVPDRYLSFAARYPIALNGRVKDIRKSGYSESRLGPGDAWDGPVIVKSELNTGGATERVLGEPLWLLERPRMLGAWRAMRRVWEGSPPFTGSSDYRICERRQEVPAAVFQDRRFIVEKFLPEIEDGLYWVRTFHFLGDRWTCTRLGSRDPIVKVRTTIRAEPIAPAPETEVWRRRFHLDYGKIDYVLAGGRAVLLDINKTTGSSQVERPVDLPHHREHRAAGIDCYLRRPANDRDD